MGISVDTNYLINVTLGEIAALDNLYTRLQNIQKLADQGAGFNIKLDSRSLNGLKESVARVVEQGVREGIKRVPDMPTGTRPTAPTAPGGVVPGGAPSPADATAAARRRGNSEKIINAIKGLQESVNTLATNLRKPDLDDWAKRGGSSTPAAETPEARKANKTVSDIERNLTKARASLEGVDSLTSSLAELGKMGRGGDFKTKANHARALVESLKKLGALKDEEIEQFEKEITAARSQMAAAKRNRPGVTTQGAFASLNLTVGRIRAAASGVSPESVRAEATRNQKLLTDRLTEAVAEAARHATPKDIKVTLAGGGGSLGDKLIDFKAIENAFISVADKFGNALIEKLGSLDPSASAAEAERRRLEARVFPYKGGVPGNPNRGPDSPFKFFPWQHPAYGEEDSTVRAQQDRFIASGGQFVHYSKDQERRARKKLDDMKKWMDGFTTKEGFVHKGLEGEARQKYDEEQYQPYLNQYAVKGMWVQADKAGRLINEKGNDVSGYVRNGILMSPREAAQVREGKAHPEPFDPIVKNALSAGVAPVWGGLTGAHTAHRAGEKGGIASMVVGKAPEEIKATSTAVWQLTKNIQALEALNGVNLDKLAEQVGGVMQAMGVAKQPMSKGRNGSGSSKSSTRDADKKKEEAAKEAALQAAAQKRLAEARAFNAQPFTGDPKLLRADLLRNVGQLGGMQLSMRQLALQIEEGDKVDGFNTAPSYSALKRMQIGYSAKERLADQQAEQLAMSGFGGPKAQDLLYKLRGIRAAGPAAVDTNTVGAIDEALAAREALAAARAKQKGLGKIPDAQPIKLMMGERAAEAYHASEKLREEMLAKHAEAATAVRQAESRARIADIKLGDMEGAGDADLQAKKEALLLAPREEYNKKLRETQHLLTQQVATVEGSISAEEKKSKATKAQFSLLDSFSIKLRNLAMYFGGGMILYNLANTITRGLHEAMRLEKEFAQVQGVFGQKYGSDRRTFEAGTFQAAYDYGTDIRSAMNAGKVFAQTGKSPADAVLYGRAALAGQIGAGLDANQATEMLIAVDNVMGGRVGPTNILDRISRVEAQYAVTAQDLSVAVQQAGSIMQQMQPNQIGSMDSMDVLMGAVTQIIQATRVTGSQAGTSMRFMLSRLASPDVTRDLQQKYGIRLAGETPDTMRPVSDIIAELSDKYKELKGQGKTVEATRMLATFAGARQLNTAAALLENWDKAMKVAAVSSESFGDTQKRVEIQMDTLAAKTEQLNVAFLAFTHALLDKTGVMAILKTFVVPGATGLTGMFQGAPGGGLALAGGLGARGAAALSTRLATSSPIAAGMLGSSATFFRMMGTVGLVLTVTQLLTEVLRYRQQQKEKYGDSGFDPVKFREGDAYQAYASNARSLGVGPDQAGEAVRAASERAQADVRGRYSRLEANGRRIFSLSDDARATDPALAKATQDAFVERLAELIPGLREVGDSAAQAAAALSLLRDTEKVGNAAITESRKELEKQLTDEQSALSKAMMTYTTAPRKGKYGLTTEEQALWLNRRQLQHVLPESFGQMSIERGLGIFLDQMTDGLGGMAGTRTRLANGQFSSMQKVVGGMMNGNDRLTLGGALDSYARDNIALDSSRRSLVEAAERELDAQGAIVDATQFEAEVRTQAAKAKVKITDEEIRDAVRRKQNADALDKEIRKDVDAKFAIDGRLRRVGAMSGVMGGDAGGNTFSQEVTRSYARVLQERLEKFDNMATPEARGLQQLIKALEQRANRPAQMAELDAKMSGRSIVRDRIMEAVVRYQTRKEEIEGLGPALQRIGVGYDIQGSQASNTQQLLGDLYSIPAQLRGDAMRRISESLQKSGVAFQQEYVQSLADGSRPEMNASLRQIMPGFSLQSAGFSEEQKAAAFASAEAARKAAAQLQDPAYDVFFKDAMNASNDEVTPAQKDQIKFVRENVLRLLEKEVTAENVGQMLLTVPMLRETFEVIAGRQARSAAQPVRDIDAIDSRGRLIQSGLEFSRAYGAADLDFKGRQAGLRGGPEAVIAYRRRVAEETERLTIKAAEEEKDSRLRAIAKQQEVTQNSLEADRQRLQAEQTRVERVQAATQATRLSIQQIEIEERLRQEDLELQRKKDISTMTGRRELSAFDYQAALSRATGEQGARLAGINGQSGAQAVFRADIAAADQATARERARVERDARLRDITADTTLGPLAERNQRALAAEAYEEALVAADRAAAQQLQGILYEEESRIAELRRGAAVEMVKSAGAGLTDFLSSYENFLNRGGQGLAKLLLPLASTFSQRLASSFTDNLVGPNGFFGDALTNLFDQNVFMEASAIRTAHIEGIRQGFLQASAGGDGKSVLTSAVSGNATSGTGWYRSGAGSSVRRMPEGLVSALAPGGTPTKNAAYYANKYKAYGLRPELAQQILDSATKNGIDPDVMFALIRHESEFNPRATSNVGARGLMQVMPATGAEILHTSAADAGNRLYDPETNLDAGTRHLRWLMERYNGDLTKVLPAYNRGHAGFERYGHTRGTRSYMNGILMDAGFTTDMPTENRGLAPVVVTAQANPLFNMPVLTPTGFARSNQTRLGPTGAPLTAAPEVGPMTSLAPIEQGAWNVAVSGSSSFGLLGTTFREIQADAVKVDMKKLEKLTAEELRDAQKKLALHNAMKSGALLALTLGAGALGNSLQPKGRRGNNYAQEGAQYGAMLGSVIPGVGTVLGTVLGSIGGGLLGGLIGKPKQKVTPELGALELIERNTRESVTAIENQTKMMELDTRFLNAPSGFTVPNLQPFGTQSGNGGAAAALAAPVNLTVNVSGAGDPKAVGEAVAAEIKRQLTDNGSFSSSRY